MPTRTLRRASAIAVLAAASAALVATTPGSPPTHDVGSSAIATGSLSADAPTTATSLTFSASDEALWSDDPAVIIRGGSLTVDARWIDRAADAVDENASDAADGGAQEAPLLGLTLISVADDHRVPVEPGTDPGAATVQLLGSCEADRDCALTFEAIVEWINPPPEGRLEYEIVANAEISIEGPELPRPGAESALAFDDPVARELPVVSDDLESESLRIGAERPLAMWSIRVTGSPQAMAEPLAWPIEPRGVLTVSVETDHAPDPASRPDPPPVSITLIPAGDAEEVPIQLFDGGADLRLDLFERCEAARCERDYTLAAAWLGPDADDAASVSWSLDASLAYHDGAVPPDGAIVSVDLLAHTVVQADGPQLTATVDGDIPIAVPDDPVTTRIVRVRIPESALAPELLGGPVPAITGDLEVRSTTSQPIDPESRIQISGAAFAPHGRVEVPHPGRASRTVTIRPAPDCRAGALCETDVRLSAEASARDARFEGLGLTVHWQLTVRLIYPEGVDLPDERIELRDGLP